MDKIYKPQEAILYYFLIIILYTQISVSNAAERQTSFRQPSNLSTNQPACLSACQQIRPTMHRPAHQRISRPAASPSR
jgi:hypothetical protein